MVSILSSRYRKQSAFFILYIFFMQGLVSVVYAGAGNLPISSQYRVLPVAISPTLLSPGRAKQELQSTRRQPLGNQKPQVKLSTKSGQEKVFGAGRREDDFIGGPSQPEMGSFKPIGADNMVNLFTGDFSYNIPLMDVGGYPVNIFYNSGISMDQDAGWVGLGWNINPGSVTRNMRGIPDDFDGTETLQQTQVMKPNITWGLNAAADVELVGVKDLLSLPVGANAGIEFNNYLGPALNVGLKGGVTLNVTKAIEAEKHASDTSFGLKLNASVNASLGSRSGFSLSPSISLTASQHTNENSVSFGSSLSTSYNSRSGVKAMQLNEQVSYSHSHREYETEKDKEDNLKFKDYSSSNGALAGTAITFTKPSYMPALRLPVTNSAYSGHFQLGGAIWGVQASAEVEVYKQVARVDQNDQLQVKPMVGYLYYGKAKLNDQAVMDFTRLGDKEVTATTPIISAPQYTYDVFSIQGEGTGGSIRFYRDDAGYMRDNLTRSKDESFSAGADVSVPGQYGVNINIIHTPSTIGPWEDGNLLRSLPGFGKSNGLHEAVYFRNPGETSVLQDNEYAGVGETDLVRYMLGGLKSTPLLLPKLQRFNKKGSPYPVEEKPLVDIGQVDPQRKRNKRTQVTSFLTAAEADKIGLEKAIRSYSQGNIAAGANLTFEELPRIDGNKLAHHISQINVTEADGKRYIYGVPVYNLSQTDYTFSVAKKDDDADPDRVEYENNEITTGSPHLDRHSQTLRDGFYQKTSTPPYAHSYLLTGLLSPDYVDVDGNGISENDLGTAVKFNYTQIKLSDGSPARYKWRTPYAKTGHIANFNAGNLSEQKDDKALFSVGERESWYLHSIESKTMIAFFVLEDRKDGKGVSLGDDNGIINLADVSLKRLKQIDLYNKADIKANGLSAAKPVKSVHFEYSYQLCPDAPGNAGTPEYQGGNEDVNALKGKLTLERIYTTYNGKSSKKDRYVFNYGNAPADNPAYAVSSVDRWNTFKPQSLNPGAGTDHIRNRDYPYALQPASTDDPMSNAVNSNAAVWSLKKILLPSGGQLEVDYESDDYAYVQDRPAMDMMPIVAYGNSETAVPPVTGLTQNLYELLNGNKTVVDNNYVFIRVPEACSNAVEVKAKYLEGTGMLAFRLAVLMKGNTAEYITCYAEVEDGGYGVITPQMLTGQHSALLDNADGKIIWVRLKPVNGGENYGPLSLTVLEFLREQLPGQAYPGSDVADVEGGLNKIGKALSGMMEALQCAFTKPVDCFRENGLARTTKEGFSFVRLNDPDGRKYGGGYRVKEIRMRDNWKEMTSTGGEYQQGAVYGNRYEYTTTGYFGGATKTISSGVASYEPSIGGEENPFQSILKFEDRLPLGPTSYGAVDMPILDAFFPSPLVGYSKVTVKSLSEAPADGSKKLRSVTGRQVHEFYTAKDYPLKYSYTPIDQASDFQDHQSSTTLFLYKYAFDSRAISQGFQVEINDMHGKQKSVASYPEAKMAGSGQSDANTPLTYTEYFYRNTGNLGMDEKFDFLYPSREGVEAPIIPGNMGIDVELMTDTREFSVRGKSLEVQGQIDMFSPITWLPFIWPVTGESEIVYRAVTATKIVNYHAIVDKIIAIDKGSKVSTENLVYDAETGNVLITKTNNEFDQPIYNITYPAWWAYGGMGLAYKNIDATYSGASFTDGVLSIPGVADITTIFESGDELYIQQEGASTACDAAVAYTAFQNLIWAFDKKKDQTPLNTVPDLIFINEQGIPYNHAGVSFRIVRSGHRNILGAPMASVTSMASPVIAAVQHPGWNQLKDFASATDNVVSASAVEYKEKWQIDADVIGKYKLVFDGSLCQLREQLDCANGYLDKSINPYLTGLVGNFRGYKNWIFYGDRQQADIATPVNLSKDGYLNEFTRFWTWQEDQAVPGFKRYVPLTTVLGKWTSNTEATKFNSRGMELETRDALGIYTAASYGYAKSIPLAVATNARSHEMFYTGFEDANYDDHLNTVRPSCPAPHFPLPDGALIVNAEQDVEFPTKAHSGKKVLKVKGNLINTAEVDNYQDNLQLQMMRENATVLTVPGVAVDVVRTDGLTVSTPNVSPGNLSMNMHIGGTSGPSVNVKINTRQYIEIGSTSNYTFTFNVSMGTTTSISQAFEGRCNIIFKVKTLSGVTLAEFEGVSAVLSSDEDSPQESIEKTSVPKSVCLPAGKYLIECECNGNFDNADNTHVYFDWGFASSATTISYKNAIENISCSYLTPLATVANMLNNKFSPLTEKQYLVSGWVRQNCTGQSCGDIMSVTYNGSAQVDNISPDGPKIEGWQRFEKIVSIPPTATSATFIFKPGNASIAYFDDLRIHPYDANMKSYVYDPVSLRLVAELNENNYTTFYEYDEEGMLVRTKVETEEGVKTLTESRSATQTQLTQIQ